MRLDEQLPDRGPRAPVRPGGGSRAPILIILALVVASGGIFLATQMRDSDTQLPDAIPQLRDREGASATEKALPPPATGPAGERARAIDNPASWVTNEDYPPEALRNNEQGSVGIAFTVKPNGRVSDCKVVQGSGSQLLDRTTCALITERARYSPALDAEGRAVDQTLRLRFRWQIQA